MLPKTYMYIYIYVYFTYICKYYIDHTHIYTYTRTHRNIYIYICFAAVPTKLSSFIFLFDLSKLVHYLTLIFMQAYFWWIPYVFYLHLTHFIPHFTLFSFLIASSLSLPHITGSTTGNLLSLLQSPAFLYCIPFFLPLLQASQKFVRTPCSSI